MKTENSFNLRLLILICTFALNLTHATFAQTATSTPIQNDKVEQAKARLNEGAMLMQQGTTESLKAAISKVEEARKLYQEVGNEQVEAICLLFLGRTSDILGEKAKALEYHNQALSLSIKIGSLGIQAPALANIGFIYESLGEKVKALEYLDRALPIFRQVGDQAGEANTLNKIGEIYAVLGENQKALEYFNQALFLRKQVADKTGEAITLHNIGFVHATLGENQKALEYYIQSLPIRRQVGDRVGEAATLNNIGRVYVDLGENQKALEYYNQSLPIRRQVGDKRGEATTLNNIGAVYAGLGEKQKALEYFDQASPLFSQIGDKQGEAATLNNTGRIYAELGEKQRALRLYNQSLFLSRQIGDKQGEANTVNSIGGFYDVSGEKQKALENFNQALTLFKQIGDKRRESAALNNIGGIYSILGENQKALEYFNQSLLLSTRIDHKVGEALTHNNLMLMWNNLKNPQIAIFYGKQSINTYQQLRSSIIRLDKSTQQTYLNSISYTYRNLVEILIRQDRLAEAQQVLNSFKDQQFFDFNPAQVKMPQPLTLTLREEEFVLRYEKASGRVGFIGEQLNELRRKIAGRQSTSDENSQMQKLEGDLKITSDELLTVLKQAETVFSKPSDEKDKVGDIPDTREMETSLRTLNQQTGQKTVAVYTLVAEDNFRALIVSPNGIKAVSTPIKGTELNEKALKLWGLLQSDRYDTTVLSKQIYDVVFAPIEKELPKDTTTIMWSLDGNLRYLPMAALWDGKQFLVERLNHVNFTRADSERMTRAVNTNWTGTGFGTSNAQTVELLGDKINFSALPGVTAELSEIFKQTDSKTGILTGEVFPDAKFTKTSFLAAMKRKRPLVHIASHFSFRPGDEARSFLLLGDGSVLTLSEMKAETNLFQGVDLLTLSACNTAAAQADANGREIDGFAELAQRLGAGAVMATLWSVSDASTPWLMRDFYATKQSKAGMTKAEALRQAQFALLDGTAETKPLPAGKKGKTTDKPQIVIVPRGEKSNQDKRGSEIIYLAENDAPLFKKDDKKPFAHPYFWSPFILFGNWR